MVCLAPPPKKKTKTKQKQKKTNKQKTITKTKTNKKNSDSIDMKTCTVDFVLSQREKKFLCANRLRAQSFTLFVLFLALTTVQV